MIKQCKAAGVNERLGFADTLKSLTKERDELREKAEEQAEEIERLKAELNEEKDKSLMDKGEEAFDDALEKLPGLT